MSYIFLTHPQTPNEILRDFINREEQKNIHLFSTRFYSQFLSSEAREGLINGSSELWVLGYSGWKSDEQVQDDISTFKHLWGKYREIWVITQWDSHIQRMLHREIVQ